MIWTPFSQWTLEGNQRFLGYALTFREEGRDVSIIHSGDTIPFAGQGEEYRRMRPDLLLLPVKGRSEALAARGIAGNLTLDEAVTLTVESEAGDDRPSPRAFRLQHSPRRRYRAEGS
jgi:hypothetical protein